MTVGGGGDLPPGTSPAKLPLSDTQEAEPAQGATPGPERPLEPSGRGLRPALQGPWDPELRENRLPFPISRLGCADGVLQCRAQDAGRKPAGPVGPRGQVDSISVGLWLASQGLASELLATSLLLVTLRLALCDSDEILVMKVELPEAWGGGGSACMHGVGHRPTGE